MNISLSPFAPEKLVSRDGSGRPVPRQPAHSSSLTSLQLCAVSCVREKHKHPIYFHGGVHSLFIPPYAIGSVPSLSGHTHYLRTDDGVHCRESAGTGRVVLKAVPVTNDCCLISRSHHGPIDVRLSFPTPTIDVVVVIAC